MPNKYDDDYTRVSWENLPSHNTPINQQNLNKMDAQIKTLTTRVSDMSTYVPNVMYVDELPEQGVEGLLYVVSLIEHGFELTGLPERYQSQSALDTWINQGNFAFMLHLDGTFGESYVIIENVTITIDNGYSGFINVSEVGESASAYYSYSFNTKQWDSNRFSAETGDKLVAFGEPSETVTFLNNYNYAVNGDITNYTGIENIIGSLQISHQLSPQSGTQTYTSSNNTYEIYQAKPIRVLDPRNVYMWNDDTRSFFGFQKEYENGRGIKFNEQGTHVTISADTEVLQEKLVEGANISIVGNVISSTGGGGGGGSYIEGKGINISGSTISADANTYNPTYSCAVDLDDISVSGYNVTLTTNAKYVDIYQNCFNTTGQNYNNMKFSPTISFRNESGTEYHKSWNLIKKIQFYYSGSTWKVKFVVNISKDKWLTVIHDDHNVITATVSNEYYLTSSNAGDGISITNGVISVSYPNGDNIEY